jgi:hypothetical protein
MGVEMRKKILVIGGEGIGRGDEDLGFEILVSLLDTLLKRGDRPHAILFWNKAVQYLSSDSPLLSRLKGLEDKGVRILGGMLCVKELGIEGKMKVGGAVTMDEILELFSSFEVVNL